MALFTGISKLNKADTIALTDLLSVALVEDLNIDDQNALGNILTTVGSLIITFASLIPPDEINGIPLPSTNNMKGISKGDDIHGL